jgi:hypothetical protein
LPKVRGTLWDAYNGVTELIDHRKTPYDADTTLDRLNSIWFGRGAAIKERALRVAEQMATPAARSNGMAMLFPRPRAAAA